LQPSKLLRSWNELQALFDVNFDKLGHVLEWDGNKGLGNLWGLYYQFPDADSIKHIYGTQMDEDPALQKSGLWN
jgi:hypothetical protein